jgi:hypothetical protein
MLLLPLPPLLELIKESMQRRNCVQLGSFIWLQVGEPTSDPPSTEFWQQITTEKST